MKRYLYYIIPFIFVPVLMLIFQYLDDSNIVNLSPYILIIVLTLISVFAGISSPTHKIFNYIITIITPLSFFGFMFIIGFLDKGDLETRFHLDRALKAVSQPWCLIAYCVMALTTFLASFKPIRITKFIKWNKAQDKLNTR